ncbi:hypothetical protein U9M48_005097 [Paspalum notatum var. saurae]|uniref:Uncharacterized protein n=1 Tax=Paspalum notatum var. saurae TaxID=547442 RepID=A0AAQ3SJL4_PASNO
MKLSKARTRRSIQVSTPIMVAAASRAAVIRRAAGDTMVVVVAVAAAMTNADASTGEAILMPDIGGSGITLAMVLLPGSWVEAIYEGQGLAAQHSHGRPGRRRSKPRVRHTRPRRSKELFLLAFSQS